MKLTDLFKNNSFFGLFVSQATGAFNDNALKMILISLVYISLPKEVHGQYNSAFTVLFLLPFVFLGPLAGWYSDRHSKRKVLLIFKATEFLILACAMWGIYIGSWNVLMILLGLMGIQSAFYGPAKLGVLKEIVEERRLGQANGIISMGTVLAIIAGTIAGPFLFEKFTQDGEGLSVIIPVAILVIFSLIGFVFTFRLEPLAGKSENVFSMKEFFVNVGEIFDNRILRLTVIGNSYFWFAASFLYLVLLLFGTNEMGMEKISSAAFLFVYLSIGVAMGSLIVAKLSIYRVETGFIPVGSLGMCVTSFLLPTLAGNYWLAVGDIFFIGMFGGMFMVPLNTLLQLESDDKKRGRFIAISTMFENIGMIVAATALGFFTGIMKLSPGDTLLILGSISLVVTIFVFRLLPEAFFRLILGVLTNTVYKIDSVGVSKIPSTGPVLLTPNHISFVDGLVLQFGVPHRKVRFVVYESYFDKPLIGWVLRMAGCIPISETRAKDAIEKTAESLQNGDVVCIFPEGSITRIGFLLPFKRGVELILRKAPEDTVIIPVYMDKLWGSIFSFKWSKFFKKIPERVPYPVVLFFGDPVDKNTTAFALRQKVLELGARAFDRRTEDYKTLASSFIRTAKHFKFHNAAADITGKPIKYFKLLASSILMSKIIASKSSKDEMIGIILPSSSVGVIVNIATALSGGVAVNLNFTSGEDAISKYIEKCDMKTIITSKLFIKRLGLEKRDCFVYVEDMAKSIGPLSKVFTAIKVIFLPPMILDLLYNRGTHLSTDMATVIFSSGSTGDPKGIVLTHNNVMSNLEMANEIVQFNKNDTLIGSLPLFHSFGYTVTLWLSMLKGVFTVYVPDPLDAKVVGEMADKYKATLMLGTPTFYSLYARKCTADQFSHLRLAVAGAEKLRANVAEAFYEKFSVSIVEGYGATEMSPIVSCNIPNYDEKGMSQRGTKEGSVGLPLPGVSVKVVDPEDYDKELTHNEEGMLLVSGANRMEGYLNDSLRTEEATHNGYYVTGDIGKIDDEGFIYIIGRLSRFSKIAGEMVPHIQIEELLHKVFNFDSQMMVVSSTADEAKGEKLIVLYLPEVSDLMNRAIVSEKLKAEGISNLWIPKEFYEVESFPLLGSGKLDLKGIQDMADKVAGSK